MRYGTCWCKKLFIRCECTPGTRRGGRKTCSGCRDAQDRTSNPTQMHFFRAVALSSSTLSQGRATHRQSEPADGCPCLEICEPPAVRSAIENRGLRRHEALMVRNWVFGQVVARLRSRPRERGCCAAMRWLLRSCTRMTRRSRCLPSVLVISRRNLDLCVDSLLDVFVELRELLSHDFANQHCALPDQRVLKRAGRRRY